MNCSRTSKLVLIIMELWALTAPTTPMQRVLWAPVQGLNPARGRNAATQCNVSNRNVLGLYREIIRGLCSPSPSFWQWKGWGPTRSGDFSTGFQQIGDSWAAERSPWCLLLAADRRTSGGTHVMVGNWPWSPPFFDWPPLQGLHSPEKAVCSKRQALERTEGGTQEACDWWSPSHRGGASVDTSGRRRETMKTLPSKPATAECREFITDWK